MPRRDPISLQAHLDWLLIADPADLPAKQHEGTTLHLYLEPLVLATLGAPWDQPDPARIGSADWQRAQITAHRVEPTYDWALRIKAFDAAEGAIQAAPTFLNQLRRLQRQVLETL
ncbi:MAG: hypothetical protein ABI743_05680, partial [bacterium]